MHFSLKSALKNAKSIKMCIFLVQNYAVLFVCYPMCGIRLNDYVREVNRTNQPLRHG